MDMWILLDWKGQYSVYIEFSSVIARTARQPRTIRHHARMILPISRSWRSLYATHIIS